MLVDVVIKKRGHVGSMLGPYKGFIWLFELYFCFYFLVWLRFIFKCYKGPNNCAMSFIFLGPYFGHNMAMFWAIFAISNFP